MACRGLLSHRRSITSSLLTSCKHFRMRFSISSKSPCEHSYAVLVACKTRFRNDHDLQIKRTLLSSNCVLNSSDSARRSGSDEKNDAERTSTDDSEDSSCSDTDDKLIDGVGNDFNLQKDPVVKSIMDDIKRDFQSSPTTSAEVKNTNSEPNATDFNMNSNNSEISVETYTLDSKPPSDFEYDYSVAEDIEEYDYIDETERVREERPEKTLPISLEHGKDGVFDLEELLTLLEYLGGEDIVSIPVPAAVAAQFCDHMVIVSAKSSRHLQAISEELLWVHKRKKSKREPHLMIEGKDKSQWHAMDMGNIILHIFHGDLRSYYNLESLWTLGPEQDPLCQEQTHDPYALSAEELFWLETGNTLGKDEGKADTDEHMSSKPESPVQSVGDDSKSV